MEINITLDITFAIGIAFHIKYHFFDMSQSKLFFHLRKLLWIILITPSLPLLESAMNNAVN